MSRAALSSNVGFQWILALWLECAFLGGVGCKKGGNSEPVVKTAAVSGQVVLRHAKGVPSDAKVMLETMTDIEEEKKYSELTTETDDDGKFTLTTALEGRTYIGTISLAGYFDETLVVEFPKLDQTRSLDPVQLTALPNVTGRVVGCVHSEPVRDVAIEAQPAKLIGTTGADGTFKLGPLPATTTSLKLTFRGVDTFEPLDPQRADPPLMDKGDIYLCKDNGGDGLRQFVSPYELNNVGHPFVLDDDRLLGMKVSLTNSSYHGESIPGGQQGIDFTSNFAYNKYVKIHRIERDEVHSNAFDLPKGSTVLVPIMDDFSQWRLYFYGMRRFRGWQEVDAPDGYYVGVTGYTPDNPPYAIYSTEDGLSIGSAAPGAPAYRQAKVTGEVGAYYLVISSMCAQSSTTAGCFAWKWQPGAYIIHVVSADATPAGDGSRPETAPTRPKPDDSSTPGPLPPGPPRSALGGSTLNPIDGTVVEVLDGGKYTFLRVKTPAGDTWVAVPRGKFDVGQDVNVLDSVVMKDFTSTAAKHTFPEIWFGKLGGVEAPSVAP